MLKKFNSGRTSNSLFNEDFEDYYDYEEPLPQGPTRPPPSSSSKKVTFPQDDDYPEDDYYDYYEEEELPRGPTREPPLPSGPTRRPGQATTLRPGRARPAALQQVLSLPLLTTKRPRKLRLPDTEAQREVLQEFGPFEEHFIAPPQINAGALPLALNEDLPLFPPFNKPKK